MPRLVVNVAGQFKTTVPQQQSAKPRVVSREPFSAVASFVLGFGSGIAAAAGAGVTLFTR